MQGTEKKAPIVSVGTLQDFFIDRSALAKLEVGGKVMYSTCTADPAENEEIISAFLKAHAGYSAEETRLLLPDDKGQEGFFTCIIRRNDDQHRF